MNIHAVPARDTNGPHNEDADLDKTYNEEDEEVERRIRPVRFNKHIRCLAIAAATRLMPEARHTGTRCREDGTSRCRSTARGWRSRESRSRESCRPSSIGYYCWWQSWRWSRPAHRARSADTRSDELHVRTVLRLINYSNAKQTKYCDISYV